MPVPAYRVGHVRHGDPRAKLDPQKRRVDGQPLYVLDGERVRTKAPTSTVFNCRYNGMVDKPLPAKPGERLLLLLDVGPSNT